MNTRISLTKGIWCCLLIAATMVSACSKDFIDKSDPNASSVNDAIQSEADVVNHVNGIYEALRDNDILSENSGLYTDERSDDGGRDDNQSNAGEPFQFNDFSILPSNSYLKRHWLGLYQSITRANFVLDRMEDIPFTDEGQKAQLRAQTKFLRALFYYHLVRKWGDVPLVTVPLTTQEEIQASTYRENQAVVYEQIIADLSDAVSSPLPEQQTGGNLGRVSKAAANALLGEVYLTMAKTLDNDDRQSHLEQARTYLTAAYNMRSFNRLADIPYTDVFDVDRQANCPEIIFSVVYIQGDQNFSSRIAANSQAAGETINSRRPGSGVGMRASLDLVNDYEEDDLRKDFTVKFANAPSVGDWFVTKYRDTSEAAGDNGFGGNNWVLMRYADVILQLAEIHAELGNDGEAITYLNMVRERAERPTYQEMQSLSTYTSKYPTLKLAILHERRSELAFEHKRLFDLLRFFTIEELTAFFRSKQQSEYGRASLNNFSGKDRYFPIPLDEYRLDPERMYQNPGY
ncbi:RagB/SusD family nutrient uptake outer membrane protein [Olivibacter sp. SDN3]|uniref:RagB/SusD family nutrient uptake outer membrane protein n=1 Tax=Olivibacter sp. SDN3 TaxID=2764720 RepID=UPI0016511F7F|nr:RagB/SusD family nutrient uptake outer membrane protein [Olivibacter sp. SDN3]QNL51450.1 RagB/SusD family nutrient uptake outer membrane protein [Olivibacter sp. SDN3]